MNREIKFRGKRIDKDVFVFGDMLTGMGYKKGKFYILPNLTYYPGDCNGLDGYEVIPETVGQFTGLLDGNGQEIFEGDIMRIPETEFNIEIIGVVEFNRGSYVVRSFFSGTRSSLAWAIRERQSGERRGVVIGNIHDNPELFKTETL